MKAIRIHMPGGPEELVYEEAPDPRPGEGDVLVRVFATGGTPGELHWPITWKNKDGGERHLPILGHDFSGNIAGVGPGISERIIGTPVYGLTDFRDGTVAEYALARYVKVASKPRSLDYIQAASVPLAALTAWQSLFIHAHLSVGQTVLIHGAACRVGGWAVQLARWQGARVIASASEQHRDFLRALGADEVIDGWSGQMVKMARDVDVVLDTVGEDTRERSWSVLERGGVVVSLTKVPSVAQAAGEELRWLRFTVQPNQSQLRAIGELIDRGILRPIPGHVWPLWEARQASEQVDSEQAQGKTVLKVVA